MLHLRPYQTDAINQMRTLMQKGCKSILYTAPTGSGKTALTAHMLHTAASKGMRSLFVVHRRELIKQSIEAFNKEGLRHGVISAGFIENREPAVQLASVQTLSRRLNRLGTPRLIVWDECHHLASKSWSGLFSRFNGAYHIGLSASPERLDGKGLGTYFSQIICGPSVQTLTAQGFLSPYKLYAPSRISTVGLHTQMGDYVRSELSRVMDKPSIIGDAVAHYKKFCYGKRAIVFAVSIEHSKHIVEKFQQEGFNATHVDGETDADVRDRAVQDFKAGNIQVLSNVELFGEGYDCPAIEAAILLRPTQSLGLYIQQVGRALRPSEGKTTAIIMDHTGNCERHGLPDEERQWSLEGHSGASRKEGRVGISVKICPSCFAAQISGFSACKFCGFVFPIESRKVQQKDGELSEVDINLLRFQKTKSRRQQGMAQSMQELYEIGKARGMKNPRGWAYYVFKARQIKRNRGIAV